MMPRPEQPDDKRFQWTWAALHVLAAINCAAIIMHIGSARYHWKRATNARTDED